MPQRPVGAGKATRADDRRGDDKREPRLRRLPRIARAL